MSGLSVTSEIGSLRKILLHRPGDEIRRGQALHDTSTLHDRQPVAHMGDDAEVVADHDEGELVVAPDLFQQVQDLGLNRGVES